MGNQKYKEKHRKMGLCENCSRPAYPDRRYCLKHLRSHARSQRIYEAKNKQAVLKRHRQLKQKRFENGRCKMCGGLLDDPQYKNCQNCREKLYVERIENAYPII
jgi:uncharacterized OB-fold protein